MNSYAGFWRRGFAYLIDIIPIVFLVGAFGPSFGLEGLGSIQLPDSFDSRVHTKLLQNQIRDISLVVWLVYSFLCDCSPLQGTLGKRILGIKVVDKHGFRLSLFQALLRNVSKILSIIPFGLGAIWIAFQRNKQGWHDLIAKSYVVSN